MVQWFLSLPDQANQLHKGGSEGGVGVVVEGGCPILGGARLAKRAF